MEKKGSEEFTLKGRVNDGSEFGNPFEIKKTTSDKKEVTIEIELNGWTYGYFKNSQVEVFAKMADGHAGEYLVLKGDYEKIEKGFKKRFILDRYQNNLRRNSHNLIRLEISFIPY
ncbi:hypothetical protein HC823_00080 [Candidatus Gracilibacteria bacterium]|nr:hypothetical protein [Candidatus Gracilibacteria bacterium]